MVTENYDEIVFRSPSPAFQQCLMQYGAATRNGSKSSKAPTAWPEHYLVFDDSLDMEVLLGIQHHLQKQLLGTIQTHIFAAVKLRILMNSLSCNRFEANANQP